MEKKAIYEKCQLRFKYTDEWKICASSDHHEKERDDIPNKELNVKFIPKFPYKYLNYTVSKKIVKCRYLVDSRKTKATAYLVIDNR